ncbi:MAG TPA: rhomboid family intramembrane serine protease [Vicinamibacterales bacterium]|nr:rhomboid family intramembrane serine protease [Vicinamibacterales bacterium]
MFKRQTTGSVVCASCGYLVGVMDDRCYHCGRRNPGLWGFAPALRSLGQDLGFVPLVTGLSVIAYVASLVFSAGRIGLDGLNFLAPDPCVLYQFGGSGFGPVFVLERWWTVLSAAWLHGSLLHIFLNMYWVRQLGPAVAELYGPGRMVIVYTAGAIVGFALSSTAGFLLGFLPPILSGAPLTVGASASIFGLLGALVHYGRRSGSQLVGSTAWSYAVTMFVFGLIMPGIDNYAHAGGFLGGWLAGRLLDPLHPERINHMLIAVVCLVLSLLSIVASLLVRLPPLPFC